VWGNPRAERLWPQKLSEVFGRIRKPEFFKLNPKRHLLNYPDMKNRLTIIIAIALLGGLILVLRSGSRAVNQNSSSTASQNTLSANYRDGTYTGKPAETPYGPVQIRVIVAGAKISDVQFLQMPSDEERSREITAFAAPALKANTIKAQSAKIDFVSGATSTSFGYQESLQAALDQAKQT